MNGLPELHLPVATSSQIFVGTLGRILIWSGIGFFALSFFASIFAPNSKKVSLASFAFGCVSVIGAFIVLGSLFIRGQYEFQYVFQHSQASDPLKYKIAAIWSGQEGSFLLWATTSSIFGLLTIWSTGIYRRWFSAVYSLFLAAICGILAYESPFVLQTIHGFAYIPPTGLGMNASLQNYWVVIHPPTIFMGFGSLTVLFAYAFSALMLRNYKDWVPKVRPWSLVSLSLVGIGLCMGGFWAYETLGWGGFWKWDPVENVSFVPWCITAALIHGFIVQGTKGKWLFSNLLLAGLPFILFVYGTFLTRAGFLDGVSVHSFAEMEHTAHMVLLTLCVVVAAGFLGLWAYRCLRDSSQPSSADENAQNSSGTEGQPELTHGPQAGWLHGWSMQFNGTEREGWYRFGSIFLTLTAIATAMGMSVPLLQYVAHQKPKVVDEHLYHLILAWFFIPIMLFMAIAPFVSWRKMPWGALAWRIFNVVSITFGLVGLTMLVMNNASFGVHLLPDQWIDFPFGLKVSTMPWIMVLVGICLFTVVGNVWRLIEMWRGSKPALGSFIAHIGVATAMAGLIISRGLERTQRYAMQEEEIVRPLGVVNEGGKFLSTSTLPYFLLLHDIDPSSLDDRNNKLDVQVVDGNQSFVARPGFYFNGEGDDGQQKQMAWPAIHHDISHDTYLAIGGQQVPASDPVTLAPGASHTFTDVFDPETGAELPYRITYAKMERQGQVGTVGTRFIADVIIEDPNGKELLVKPAMKIAGAGGPQIEPADIDPDFFITLMRMDAGSHNVTLQLNYVHPLYWADLMYKPMVILVWIGAGIMTLGGLLAAFYRWRLAKAAAKSLGRDA